MFLSSSTLDAKRWTENYRATQAWPTTALSAEALRSLAGWEALWVPALLFVTVGPLFFLVAAQAPMMQRWYAAHGQAGDPYWLYAASNLGSFAGLIAYPLVLEPSLPYDATIEALRRAILAHLSAAGQAVGRFTLRTSFPARQFDRDAETLREAGLVPNASLFMTLV